MLIFSMGVSLDGYIAGPDGDFDWSAPDPELHRFHNDQSRALDVHFCGRGLYETMVYWEQPGDVGPVEQEFAGIWQALPKVVFSTTLSSVRGNARLADGSLEAELERHAGQTVAVGGAGLAGAFARRGLIDEYHLFVNPVAVGGGTPFFPPGVRLDLQLLEQRTFSSRVVYLRYGRSSRGAGKLSAGR